MLLEQYVDKQLALLDKEQELENAESSDLLGSMTKSQLQRAGLALLGLYPEEFKTCLGGRISVTFKANADMSLPKTQIRSGDVVKVESGGSEISVTGTVQRVQSDNISVIFDSDPELVAPIRLVKSGNPVAFIRMKAAVKGLKADHRVVSLALDCNSDGLEYSDNVKYTDKPYLNKQQNIAVKTAVTARNLALIHGPPGTGKTQCICAILKELKGLKVLVCAASNLAVDNIVERVDEKVSIIRIGHPARLSETILHRTLEYALYSSDSAKIIFDVKADIEKRLKELKASRCKRDVYRELKVLRAELREREQKRLDQIMDGARVIACTLITAGSSKILRHGPYDVVIIDEASQALEAEAWIATQQAPKLVLVGDHHQLPPTVHVEGLEQTLFERLHRMYPSVMLSEQYRMHQDIMGWSNARFYKNQLVAHESVRDVTCKDLSPVVFIDTSNSGMWEKTDPGGSHWNENEGDLVIKHIVTLSNYKMETIAVISPYSAQVDFISHKLEEQDIFAVNVQVNTVDGFQGREADAVIVSLVRSNANKEIGFLREARRLNVAITRARRHLCVVGDSETIRTYYGDLVEYLNDVAEVVLPD